MLCLFLCGFKINRADELPQRGQARRHLPGYRSRAASQSAAKIHLFSDAVEERKQSLVVDCEVDRRFGSDHGKSFEDENNSRRAEVR